MKHHETIVIREFTSRRIRIEIITVSSPIQKHTLYAIYVIEKDENSYYGEASTLKQMRQIINGKLPKSYRKEALKLLEKIEAEVSK